MTLSIWVVGVLALILVTLETLPQLGMDRGPVLAVWLGFSPILLQLGWLGVGFGLAAGATGTSWSHAAFAIAPSAVVATAGIIEFRRATTPGIVEPDATGAGLRVVTANLFYQNPDGARAWPVIEGYQPDVVLLQEISDVSGAWLPPAGWHCVSDARPDAFGTAILSREPLVESSVVLLGGLPQLRAVVRQGDRDIVVYSVHPRAPASWAADLLWRRQFRDLTNLLNGESPSTPVVVGGDFNATPLHRPFRALLAATGFVDARPARRGLAATWPSGGAGSVPGVPLVMCLDHVLVRGAAIRDATILPATSGDHLPVAVEIAVPSASSTRSSSPSSSGRRSPGERSL